VSPRLYDIVRATPPNAPKSETCAGSCLAIAALRVDLATGTKAFETACSLDPDTLRTG
jgi:hypothetical protein